MNPVEPCFISRAQVDRIHAQSLTMHGGSTGVRDSGLVDSALASAENAWFYGRGDLFDVAAAYAFHIAEAQAFLDGNKRTAIATSLTFLDVNGVSKVPDDNTLYDAMIGIANKQLTKSGLAALMRGAAQE